MIQARAVCAFGVGNTPFLMLMLPIFNPYGVGWSWGCRVFATDIQSLRDIFSFAAASYLSLRVQLHQFESAFIFAQLLRAFYSVPTTYKSPTDTVSNVHFCLRACR
jgi:hypothetical protein